MSALPDDWLSYWPAAVALGLGAAFAALDRCIIGRRVMAVLLMLVIAGATIGMNVSPFTFSGGDYYLLSAIAQLAAGIALGGYICAEVWHRVRTRANGAKTP